MTLNELWAQIPKQYRDLPLEMYIGIDTLMIHGPSPIKIGDWIHEPANSIGDDDDDDDLDNLFECEYPRIILMTKK